MIGILITLWLLNDSSARTADLLAGLQVLQIEPGVRGDPAQFGLNGGGQLAGAGLDWAASAAGTISVTSTMSIAHRQPRWGG